MTGPEVPQARSLHEICADARRGQCGYCCAMPSEPCAFSGTGPDGYHVARFAWAEASGLISAADMAAVLEHAGPFMNSTVIYDDKRACAVTTTEQRLAALEAEVADLRHRVVLREVFLDALENRAYRRGRESILGTQADRQPSRPRHLQAVQGGQQ